MIGEGTMRAIVWFALILIVAVHARVHATQGAEIVDRDQWMIQCTISSITGDFSTPESRYSAQGGCSVFLDENSNYPANQSTFDNQKLQYQFLWSAAGTH